ncbi:hypothetical protein Y1Q_0020701 [Alligator mississippiensis]|uniref:Uncharacterized protein n=1 Tax=Alligator mississippiensis TaxID=8496 RepID=A0A151MUT1_ALLMI|nr:hypothetical protein Y1Q_0020701 [Alligator mississippiensis]
MGEGKVLGDPGTMNIACPPREDMGEVPMVADNIMKHDGEEALLLAELHSVLGYAENEDVGAVNGSHTVWETHVAEASDDLLWVDEVHEAVHQHILDDATHLLDHFSDNGLTHTELLGKGTVDVGDIDLPDSVETCFSVVGGGLIPMPCHSIWGAIWMTMSMKGA